MLPAGFSSGKGVRSSLMWMAPSGGERDGEEAKSPMVGWRSIPPLLNWEDGIRLIDNEAGCEGDPVDKKQKKATGRGLKERAAAGLTKFSLLFEVQLGMIAALRYFANGMARALVAACLANAVLVQYCLYDYFDPQTAFWTLRSLMEQLESRCRSDKAAHLHAGAIV